MRMLTFLHLSDPCPFLQTKRHHSVPTLSGGLPLQTYGVRATGVTKIDPKGQPSQRDRIDFHTEVNAADIAQLHLVLQAAPHCSSLILWGGHHPLTWGFKAPGTVGFDPKG